MSEGAGCPLCGGPTAGVHEAREMMLGTRERFHYGECSDCGTLVLLEPPDDLGPYYPDDYYSLRPGPDEPLPLRALKRLRGAAAARGRRRLAAALGGGSPPPWMDWIRSAGLGRSAAICDVGCGRGDLLFELARAGFEHLVGVDPMIESEVSRDRVRIEKTTLDRLSDPFDLVMFNHSLEHLPDPIEELRAAGRLLADGGTVLVRAPVAGCWAWRHYGTDWVALDPPRHLFVPSPDGMRAAAARSGLRVGSIDYDSTAMQFWRSEQYRRDIALFEPGSHQLDPARSPFNPAQIRAWERRAEELNRDGDGDTAAMYLTRAGDAGGV